MSGGKNTQLKIYLRIYRKSGSTCPSQPSTQRVHRSAATTGLGQRVPGSTNGSRRTRRQTRRPPAPCGPCHYRSHLLLAAQRNLWCWIARTAHKRPLTPARAVRRYHTVALLVVSARQSTALKVGEGTYRRRSAARGYWRLSSGERTLMSTMPDILRNGILRQAHIPNEDVAEKRIVGALCIVTLVACTHSRHATSAPIEQAAWDNMIYLSTWACVG